MKEAGRAVCSLLNLQHHNWATLRPEQKGKTMITRTYKTLPLVGAIALLIGLGSTTVPAKADQATNGVSLNGVKFQGVKFQGVKFQGVKFQGRTLKGQSARSGVPFDASAVTVAAIMLPLEE
jgi:uncharacterized protein YjbI with pentapeptide repeats